MTHSKMITIKFKRDNVTRFSTFWVMPTIERLLEDIDITTDNMGAASLAWLSAWLINHKDKQISDWECLSSIVNGDWTIKFLCDL